MDLTGSRLVDSGLISLSSLYSLKRTPCCWGLPPRADAVPVSWTAGPVDAEVDAIVIYCLCRLSSTTAAGYDSAGLGLAEMSSLYGSGSVFVLFPILLLQ